MILLMKSCQRRLAAFARSRSATSAIEFAIVAPLFIIMVAGITDVGGVLVGRFALNSAVTSGTNYAVINGAKVTALAATDLATKTASIVAISSGTAQSVSVSINKNYTVTMANGQTTSSGSVVDADLCYCPTLSGNTVQWGLPAVCSSTCSNGSLAGKFVTVAATRNYTPLFSGYGVASGDVTVTSRAQAQ